MTYHEEGDSKSVRSYRSTHSTRSSVLERAREYNRRLDDQKTRRSKSADRQADASSEVSAAMSSTTPRSQSAGRVGSHHQGNRPATRERAMASLQREQHGGGMQVHTNGSNNMNNATVERRTSNSSYSTNSQQQRHQQQRRASPSPLSVEAAQGTPRSRVSTQGSAYSSHVSRPQPTTPRMSDIASPHGGDRQQTQQRGHNHHHHQQQQQLPTPQQNGRSHGSYHNNGSSDPPIRSPHATMNHRNNAPTPRESPRMSQQQQQQPRHSPQPSPQNTSQSNHNDNNNSNNQEAVVTPELLVDALSGHEDGLLAIAERLMEHYDSGYDVMGEAIIDAFADVQKLFQHVVEAAHMEGAAFESSRREEEMAELRRQAAAAGDNHVSDDGGIQSPNSQSNNNNTSAQPNRPDEFIDQDVKDTLSEAIRKGANFRNSGKFTECFQLYEAACQASSSMLPVDSDHRGRLQLSIARAESMTHERACAILRYAMDDVLRSGLRTGQHVPLPDPSQRADVVLNRTQPSGSGAAGLQSSEEALNSLVEEMREVMNAPVYNNTPLQSVAQRFLAALAENQKAQSKNEEKLEQNLAKLKGDFLLARAEWEEKLNSTQETAEVFKEKYTKLKNSMRSNHSVGGGSGGDSHNDTASSTSYLEHARSALASQQQRMNMSMGQSEDDRSAYGGYSSVRAPSRAGSHVSLSSGLANHARSIVGSFACAGGNMNQRAGQNGVATQELAENRDAEISAMAYGRHDSGMRDRDRRRTNDSRRNSGGGPSLSMSYSDRSFTSDTQSQSTAAHRRTPHSVASGSTRSKSSRSFREYSRSPQRVDF